jgi:hypothetical protein
MKMMFSRTNQRTMNSINDNTYNQQQQPQNISLPQVGFYRKSRMFSFPIPMINQNQNVSPINDSNITIVPTPSPETLSSTPKKMKWGEPTWFLLHTLAEKVKNDSFSLIRNELLSNIYTICTNLPCPVCSEHAKHYLNSINFNTILTKQDLKIILFNFHNQLNAKKGFPIFMENDLNEKYSKANTVNIIYNFMDSFLDKNRTPQMIANDMFRRRIASKLSEWFTNNIVYFDL